MSLNYLSSTEPPHCLQAVNVKNIIVLRDMIQVFCSHKHPNVLTNWCSRRYKIPWSDGPTFLRSTENLLALTSGIFGTYIHQSTLASLKIYNRHSRDKIIKPQDDTSALSETSGWCSQAHSHILDHIQRLHPWLQLT